MKRYLILLAVIALLAISAAPTMAQAECDDPIGCVEIASDDPIVIGYMLTVSGAYAPLGVDSEGGIEVAVAERDGELLGHEIEIAGEDSLCSAEGGQAAAQRLAADETVLGIIGTSCSSAAASAMPIISEAGLVLISPSNTAPTLTNSDSEAGGTYQPGYFRTAHNDLFQGSVAADFMFNILGATSLATIHDGSPYADGLQQVAADSFLERGGEITFQGAVNVGDTDMTAILTEVAANPPDVLYFPIFEPESNFIASQAKQIPGLENTILMSADGSLSDTFPENTGDAAVGMFMSGPYVSGEAYNDFLTAYNDVTGGAPVSGFHAHAYDATNILLDAIESVAVEDPEDGTLIVGRQALRDALAAVEGYEGLTGTLTCQEEDPFIGDCATGEALAIFQITQAEVDGNWPAPAVWLPGDEEMMDPSMETEGEG